MRRIYTVTFLVLMLLCVQGGDVVEINVVKKMTKCGEE